jgi:hypothetical protein
MGLERMATHELTRKVTSVGMGCASPPSESCPGILADVSLIAFPLDND